MTIHIYKFLSVHIFSLILDRYFVKFLWNTHFVFVPISHQVVLFISFL